MVAIPMGASEDQWAEVSACIVDPITSLDSLHDTFHDTGGQAED